jgi:hypothetical protein
LERWGLSNKQQFNCSNNLDYLGDSITIYERSKT